MVFLKSFQAFGDIVKVNILEASEELFMSKKMLKSFNNSFIVVFYKKTYVLNFSNI